MKINKSKITKRLSTFDIEKGSKSTNFIKRKDGKIDGEAYLTGFFMMLLSGGSTLLHWSLQICKLVDGLTLSEQGLERKLSFRHELFAKWLLIKSLQAQLKGDFDKESVEKFKKEAELLNCFNRVLLQDSTCINVPDNLSTFFPSSFTEKRNSATARLQLIIDLLSDTYEDFSLGSFRDNDGKASKDILEIVKPRDLVLRDKGYWSLEVFKQLDEKGCFFLSRLKYGVNLYDFTTKKPPSSRDRQLNLAKTLKKASKQGQNIVDKQVFLGAKHQISVRLIAVRLPQEVADERRRKAKADRHSKANHSQDYYERLDWCLFVTNIPEEILTGEEVAKVYRFRWKIEIIFKVWKSKFDFDKMFDKSSMSPSRAIITFFLLLTWLTLFFVNLYNYFLIKVYQKTKRFISIFKFSEFLIIFMQDSIKQEELLKNPDDFIDLVASSCLYDKRKRQNQMELIYC
jgi:hypothetical protein